MEDCEAETVMPSAMNQLIRHSMLLNQTGGTNIADMGGESMVYSGLMAEKSDFTGGQRP